MTRDNLTKEQRTLCMSRIKSKNTQPEKIIRSYLTKMGWRYRLHSKVLPGKPDIVISKIKTVLFINGCFWHQHKGCKRKSMPKTNIEYWHKKLKGNIQKQKSQIKKLEKLGWEPIVIWECQTKNKSILDRALRRVVEKTRV